jgi:hypothetical protein
MVFSSSWLAAHDKPGNGELQAPDCDACGKQFWRPFTTADISGSRQS